MGDVRPPRAVTLGDLHRRAQHVLLGRRPQLAEPLDRELTPFAPVDVHRVFETVHRDLAEHGRDLPFEALGEQSKPRRRVARLREQATEGHGLSEDRRRLRERERCRLVEDALLPREIGVQAVPELVRERQHIAPPRRPVEEHVRVVGRNRVRAERAGSLARAHRRVDPRLVEEPLHDVGELRRERRVRVEHEVARVPPAEHVLGLGDRRHAVVVGQPVDTEQPRLERVPALWDVVAVDDRVDERLHRLVARFVLEVATREPPVVVAQPVVNELVGEERVEHERAGAQTRLERRRDRLGRDPSPLAIGRLEARETFFEGDRLTVDVDLDRGRQLAEEPRPRALAGRGLVGEHALLGLGEQVLAVAPRRREVMPTELQPLVGEERRDVVVGQLRPLEIDEEQLVGDRRRSFLGAREQRAPRRVLRVGREPQAGVRPRPADELGDARQLAHQGRELVGAELAESSPVRLDGTGALLGVGEQRVHPRVAAPVDERLDVPRDIGSGAVGVGEAALVEPALVDVGGRHRRRGYRPDDVVTTPRQELPQALSSSRRRAPRGAVRRAPRRGGASRA